MTFGSVCSGIEAATVAWSALGWRALWYAEIDKFCSALLNHYYGEIPNYGDFTKIKDATRPDVLVGGTPCQSFSVAGRRGGLDDPRGILAFEFLALAGRIKPTWLIFENVPGLLSSDEGRDFGAFLGALAKLGYGWAYRILDAQFFGLAQRRERLFLVGYLGDWRPPAAVLFERESLRRDLAPSRETGKEVAECLRSGPVNGGPGHGKLNGSDHGPMVISPLLTAKGGTGRNNATEEAFVISHTLRADGFDASEDGTGRGSPLVVSAFLSGAGSSAGTVAYQDEQSPTLRSSNGSSKNIGIITGTLSGGSGGGSPDPSRLKNYASIGAAVRRLTPMEWERLQGFPDDYTLIPYRNKPAADGPRYKSLGNSMAVPVIRWIGERIQQVDSILKSDQMRSGRNEPANQQAYQVSGAPECARRAK